jgi:hypothetical protein
MGHANVIPEGPSLAPEYCGNTVDICRILGMKRGMIRTRLGACVGVRRGTDTKCYETRRLGLEFIARDDEEACDER